MVRKRILILGAGLSGLSVAWHLQRKGYDCQIFEQGTKVGGLCRSKKNNGFIFDCDGHLLHFKQNYTLHLIKKMLGTNLIKHKRNSWIYSYNRYTRYPFQANLYGLPKPIVKECLLEFIKINRNGSKIKKGCSFGQWIDKNFGKGIARHFMIPYNNKFWTVPLDDLTCEWIDGFIPIPSLNQIIEGTIKESRQNLGYNAFFWYPEKGGINEVSRVFANQIKNIHLGTPATEINLKRNQIRLNRGKKERFDFLISTVPLPDMLYLLHKVPEEILACFKNLRWNSIFNLNLGLERKIGNSYHWIYFPEKDFCFFRVGFPHNFSSYLTPSGKSSLYAEVSYSASRPIDKDNIVLRIKKDLKKAGILTQDNRICFEDINDIKYGYPVYDINYQQSRKRILKFLAENNIISCGRYGSWRYMSMEDVILEGKALAKRLFHVF